MDRKYKLSVAQSAAMDELGDKIMAQVTLTGGGWVVQVGKTGTSIPVIEGMEKLLEIPTIGTMQFLDDFWAYTVYATEAEARSAHPEFPADVYFLHFWLPGKPYSVGNYRNNDSRKYRCTQAGTSGALPGPTGDGTSIEDGGCLWDVYLY